MSQLDSAFTLTLETFHATTRDRHKASGSFYMWSVAEQDDIIFCLHAHLTSGHGWDLINRMVRRLWVRFGGGCWVLTLGLTFKARAAGRGPHAVQLYILAQAPTPQAQLHIPLQFTFFSRQHHNGVVWSCFSASSGPATWMQDYTGDKAFGKKGDGCYWLPGIWGSFTAQL